MLSVLQVIHMLILWMFLCMIVQHASEKAYSHHSWLGALATGGLVGSHKGPWDLFGISEAAGGWSGDAIWKGRKEDNLVIFPSTS